eukprot:931050-Prorocentrum_minimum.AAC.4
MKFTRGLQRWRKDDGDCVPLACSFALAPLGQHVTTQLARSHVLFWTPFSHEMMTEEQHEMVESSAEMLYGLIHSRYILTSRGMNAVVRHRTDTFLCGLQTFHLLFCRSQMRIQMPVFDTLVKYPLSIMAECPGHTERHAT